MNNREQFGTNRERTARIRAFEAAWARLQSEEPGWPHDPNDRAFQRALLDWLVFHNAMLIGELIPQTLSYLRGNPECPELMAFDHVIVDEYQDLNKAEQTLLNLLAGDRGLAIVGDKVQSIYSFRYAHPEGIVDFAEAHAHTHDEQLVECRRCPQLVVRIADSLIRNNYAGEADARLLPDPDNPEGEVHIVQWGTLEQEVGGLARYVQHLLANRDYEAGDVLILTPRRLIGYGIRDALLAHHICVAHLGFRP